MAFFDWLPSITSGQAGAGMLGLGALSTSLGAYSNFTQQQRQRDLFNQQRAFALEQQAAQQEQQKRQNAYYDEVLQMARQRQDPSFIAKGVQGVYQPMAADTQDALLRMVQREMGMRGVTQGGAASDIVAERMAPYALGMQQLAANTYLGGQGLASGAYGQAGGALPSALGPAGSTMFQSGLNVGVPFGDVGALGTGMRDLMMMKALEDLQKGYTSGTYTGWMPGREQQPMLPATNRGHGNLGMQGWDLNEMRNWRPSQPNPEPAVSWEGY